MLCAAVGSIRTGALRRACRGPRGRPRPPASPPRWTPAPPGTSPNTPRGLAVQVGSSGSENGESGRGVYPGPVSEDLFPHQVQYAMARKTTKRSAEANGNVQTMPEVSEQAVRELAQVFKLL